MKAFSMPTSQTTEYSSADDIIYYYLSFIEVVGAVPNLCDIPSPMHVARGADNSRRNTT